MLYVYVYVICYLIFMLFVMFYVIFMLYVYMPFLTHHGANGKILFSLFLMSMRNIAKE